MEQYAVGNRVAVKLQDGAEVEGVVYTSDVIANMVVIKQGPANSSHCPLRLINLAYIQSCKVLEHIDDPFVTLHPVSDADLEKKEVKACRAMEQAMERINQGASEEGQLIFDSLAKTMVCEWEGISIIVYGDVRIDPPYRVQDCKAIRSNPEGLARVTKVLTLERQKLKLGGEAAAKG